VYLIYWCEILECFVVTFKTAVQTTNPISPPPQKRERERGLWTYSYNCYTEFGGKKYPRLN
jgi:hypothetical protein